MDPNNKLVIGLGGTVFAVGLEVMSEGLLSLFGEVNVSAAVGGGLPKKPPLPRLEGLALPNMPPPPERLIGMRRLAAANAAANAGFAEGSLAAASKLAVVEVAIGCGGAIELAVVVERFTVVGCWSEVARVAGTA